MVGLPAALFCVYRSSDPEHTMSLKLLVIVKHSALVYDSLALLRYVG